MNTPKEIVAHLERCLDAADAVAPVKPQWLLDEEKAHRILEERFGKTRGFL